MIPRVEFIAVQKHNLDGREEPVEHRRHEPTHRPKRDSKPFLGKPSPTDGWLSGRPDHRGPHLPVGWLNKDLVEATATDRAQARNFVEPLGYTVSRKLPRPLERAKGQFEMLRAGIAAEAEMSKVPETNFSRTDVARPAPRHGGANVLACCLGTHIAVNWATVVIHGIQPNDPLTDADCTLDVSPDESAGTHSLERPARVSGSSCANGLESGRSQPVA
jgi:hypothetical protein